MNGCPIGNDWTERPKRTPGSLTRVAVVLYFSLPSYFLFSGSPCEHVGIKKVTAVGTACSKSPYSDQYGDEILRAYQQSIVEVGGIFLLLCYDTITTELCRGKFIWGIVSESWSTWPPWWGHGSRWGAMVLEQSLRAYIFKHNRKVERNWEWCVFWDLNILTNDIPPPTKPHLLILTKQYHQKRSEYSNTWTYECHSYSKHYTLPSILHGSGVEGDHNSPAFPIDVWTVTNG